jgi:uncharacterized protein YbjT (DUF2867 family)
MILVVGARGTNGREVVDRLAARGASVRALVRDPAEASDAPKGTVEFVQGDLDDPGSLDNALVGVERAFFLAAVSERYVDWFRNFLDAARRAGTSHVLRFSAMGADSESSSVVLRQHGQADRMLVESGLGYTIVRPNSFYQNLLWSARTIKDQGEFYMPLKSARQSLVDVRDIAEVSAHVLTGAGHNGKTYELTGPEPLAFDEIAATLSRVLEKPIRYVDVPLEAARQSMLKNRMPAWNAMAVTELYEVFASGVAARTTDTVERITGKRPIPFEQFARDHAAAFR